MKQLKIKNISKIEHNSKRYDVSVADNNNLFANNILIHNCQNIPHVLEQFKDKEVLCEILKYQDNIEIFRPNENFYTYSIKEDIEFQISILQNINNFQFDTGNKFYVLLNLNDEIKICNSKQEYIVDKGEALFLPANINFTIIGNNILSFLVSVK